MKIYTIGFTKKGAERFFTLLKNSGVKTLIDVRLNNASQLAAFAKKDDLAYFLKELCGIQYLHIPKLSPSEDILKSYKAKTICWTEYEDKFYALLKQRAAETLVDDETLADACFLCSEHEADLCHRRLVAEYIASHSQANVEIEHLK
ncbi:DUF488 family protein [Paraferrimonas haliotis]|uniref:DUF488 domain-containing protein n=1 Tax=Paraferrimonas haliotis TaxID=2013866 RepID=UPI000BA9771F|nr:DUF488 domain-containing protein [Paraferrimonas haliotis]